jgi:hypothetical protein
MVPPHKWQPDGLNLARGVAIGVATLGLAWLVSLFTENRTHAVRTWMRSMIPRLDSAST